MDEREKIKAALEKAIRAYVEYYTIELKKVLEGCDAKDTKTAIEFIAAALIAANIGDVTEWKERAEKEEKEREEYRKSTYIMLRGIEILKRNIIRVFCIDFPGILQQATREIEEEKGE